MQRRKGLGKRKGGRVSIGECGGVVDPRSSIFAELRPSVVSFAGYSDGECST